jgi:hypothetical protein
MGTGAAVERSLVILLFDTLRTDLFEIAAENDTALPAFHRLFALAPTEYPMWCGSFPTVPMRTDLLTARLCFLDRRWDRPQPDDHLWLSDGAQRGIATRHIGDNYMVWEERLGGYFGELFGSVERLRGVGADLWTEPSALSYALSLPPVRSEQLERQCRANLMAPDAVIGIEASMRWVGAALKGVEDASGRRSIIWIENFQAHEPWAVPSRDGQSVPCYPPYGRVTKDISSAEVTRQRRLYVRRLKEMDDSLWPLVNYLQEAEVDLLVLSDHGIYLGEYCLFGKPKDQPLLPFIGRIICRTNLPERLFGSAPQQPHELADLLASHLLRVGRPSTTDVRRTRGSSIRPIGRNSPDNPWLQFLHPEGICLFRRGGFERRFIPWSDLDVTRPWEDSGMATHPALEEARHYAIANFSKRSWVRNAQLD